MPDPQTIGRYEIRSSLGKGGQAAVYLAHDPVFGRDVAIKLLANVSGDDEDVRERFLREARAVAALEHSTVTGVYDYGEYEGQPFLVMRYMPGGTLSGRLKEGRLTLEETADIVERVGAALDAAHAAGVIHRDVKPANVLFDRTGAAYLADFGIARISQTTATLTGANIIGTPAYISPEQARGQPVTAASDIYSLGIMAYELVAGTVPFKAADAFSVILRHIQDEPQPPAQLNPSLPPAAEQTILRAIAKEPTQRFTTASEFAAALKAGLFGTGYQPGTSQTSVPVAPTHVATPSSQPFPQAAPTPSGTQGHITASLSPARYTLGTAKSGLTLRNALLDPVPVRLAAQAPADLDVSLPAQAVLPPNGEHTIDVQVRPRRKRWFGDPIAHTITFLAQAEGQPPVAASGEFIDKPRGWLPIAGGLLGIGAVGALAVGGLMLLGGGGGGDDDDGDGEPMSHEGGLSSIIDTIPAAGPVRLGVLFSREFGSGEKDIFWVGPDGEGEVNLTNTETSNEDFPAWTDDGQRFSFVSDSGSGELDIWVADSDGAEFFNLTNSPGIDTNPAWNPSNHELVAFASDRARRNGNLDIFVMDLRENTDNPTQLTDTGVNAEPTWSPNGTQIAFTSLREGNQDIYVMNAADGSDLRRLTDFEGREGRPAWSPDGTLIAFESDRGGQFEVWLMNADGSPIGENGELARRIAAGVSGNPSWSPDGTRIVFFQVVDGNEEIHTVDIETGEDLVRLTSNSQDDFSPAWSPAEP